MPTDKNRALYDSLKQGGLYTKSYDEFKKQFSTPGKINMLHSVMQTDGHYTKSADEFAKQFFTPIAGMGDKSELPPDTISVRDNRVVDGVTGNTIDPRTRLHATINKNLATEIIKKAKQRGIDPYTALAIPMQETRFTDEYSDNPFSIIFNNPNELETYQKDPVGYAMDFLSTKLATAKRLGKNTDSETIQSWNGYGKVGKNSFGKDTNNLYGIDVTQQSIDMNKRPVYGERIVNIRDSILKKNPDIIKLVDDTTPDENPQ